MLPVDVLSIVAAQLTTCRKLETSDMCVFEYPEPAIPTSTSVCQLDNSCIKSKHAPNCVRFKGCTHGLAVHLIVKPIRAYPWKDRSLCHQHHLRIQRMDSDDQHLQTSGLCEEVIDH
jgi:hypothetical protein